MGDTSTVTTTDVISYAIASQVRELGGDDDAIRNISFAASYAVVCWSLAAAQRHHPVIQDPRP